MIDNPTYNDRNVIKQTIREVALQELTKGSTIPMSVLKREIEEKGIECSTKSLINNIAAVSSEYVIKGDHKTAKKIINLFTIGFKELWVTNYVWEEKYKKPLQEYIWRDLIPYNIIEKIDFESLVKTQSLLDKQKEACEGEIRILKTVRYNGKQYDLIIDVKDPRYDWWGDSYQFFIRFTDKVNQVPLIYDNLCIKVVIPCVKGSDILNKNGITALMVFEPSRGIQRGGLFSDKVVNYFDNLLFKYEEHTPYNSCLLKKILFNHLSFIEIGKFSNADEYTVGFNQSNSFIYLKADKIYSCVVDKGDALNVVKAATKLLTIGELPNDKQLIIIYLEDKSNTRVSDFVFNEKSISIISIEEYCNQVLITEDCRLKYQEQIMFLRSLNDSDVIDSSNIKDVDRWDIITTQKVDNDFTREVNADTIIEQDGKWYVKRPKKVLENTIRQNLRKKDNDMWVGGKWYTKKEEELVAIKGQPENLPSQVGRKICHIDPKEIARVDKTPLFTDSKTIIIEPENTNTVCFIPKSTLDDAIQIITNELRDVNNKTEWFRYLCAANLVNAYKKFYDKNVDINPNNLVCNLVIDYLRQKEHNNDIIKVQYSDSKDISLMISINISNRKFQFYFRGIELNKFEELKKHNVNRGVWNKVQLQPIAPLLYKYSLNL